VKNKTKLLLTTVIVLMSVGCENVTGPEVIDDARIFIPNARLPIDDNGYYHLELNNNTWQTLHRISGWVVDKDSVAVFGSYVGWISSHYWYLGDTLGYIVNTYLNNEGVYVAVDTSYIIGFDGMEVPTTNSSSRTNQEGEVNTMFAPVTTMRGDTVKVTAYWTDPYNSNDDYEGYTFEIVLD
jgi:hypothetical protein